MQHVFFFLVMKYSKLLKGYVDVKVQDVEYIIWDSIWLFHTQSYNIVLYDKQIQKKYCCLSFATRPLKVIRIYGVPKKSQLQLSWTELALLSLYYSIATVASSIATGTSSLATVTSSIATVTYSIAPITSSIATVTSGIVVKVYISTFLSEC